MLPDAPRSNHQEQARWGKAPVIRLYCKNREMAGKGKLNVPRTRKPTHTLARFYMTGTRCCIQI